MYQCLIIWTISRLIYLPARYLPMSRVHFFPQIAIASAGYSCARLQLEHSTCPSPVDAAGDPDLPVRLAMNKDRLEIFIGVLDEWNSFITIWNFINNTKFAHFIKRHFCYLSPVWPDLASYLTLGNFLKPLAKFICPNLPHSWAIFV